MTVIKHKGAGAPSEEELKNVAFPPNGVIYVSGSCAKAYAPFGPVPGYSEDTTCGNVYVHGNYTSALTIAAQNDVIINGNLTTAVNGGSSDEQRDAGPGGQQFRAGLPPRQQDVYKDRRQQMQRRNIPAGQP